MIGLVRGVIHRRQNVFALEGGIIGEDFLERCAAGDQFQNIGDSNPLSANAGTSAALAWLDSNPAQPFWAHIFTLLFRRLLARVPALASVVRPQRYGLVTVFIPALVPLPFLPFKAFAACAGAMGVSRWRFLGVLAVGRILRYAGLAYLGVKLGTVENSKAWVKAHTWHMVFVAAAIFLFFYLLLKFLDREAVEQ